MTEEKRPIAVDDLYKIIKIEDPQISPDGRYVAFVRVTVDKIDNGYKRSIWLSEMRKGSEPRQLTRGTNDMNPRWSPNGETLAFVSARAEKPQVFLLSVGAFGGEARQLTSLPNGAVMPEWSPDGAMIAFLASLRADEREKEDQAEEETPPSSKLEAKHRKEQHDEDEKKRYDPYSVWRIPYRQGTSMVDERYAHVYVIKTAEGLEGDDAKPRRLTHLNADYQPVSWTPDGRALYTARTTELDADEPFNYNGIFRIDLESGEETPVVSEGHSCFAPDVSPDGKWLAFGRVPNQERGHLEAITRLAVMPIDGGEVRDLNLTLDRDVAGFHWSADSQSLLLLTGDHGDFPLYHLPINGDDPILHITGAYKIGAYDYSDSGAIAAVISTTANPFELKFLAEDATEWVPLTAFNEKWLKDVVVQEAHEMRFPTPSGTEIQGWYILPVGDPAGYEEGQKYPLAVNIHGGPRVMWSPNEDSMWHEWQLHAARGYAVFFCNPRGGNGYGEQFQRELHAAWGDVAMEDIMAGVDALLEKGFVDEKRMAVTGGSYGGYMTAWIIGHTDRFKCAVSQRGVYNLISFYGTSDVPILITSDYSAEPWENHELLWKHSPLAYAHKVKTPLLIIHSENDYRVPIEQGEQLFAWVRRATDTPVEMVRFPRDGHELSRSGEPEHRVQRLTRMVDWFDRYCL